MKIVGTDNHDRESVADILWMDAIPSTPECRIFAQRVCDKLNEGLSDGPGTFYVIKPDNYRLRRGMEDLV